MFAMTVKVSDKISSYDISMMCPNVTAIYKTISCTFTSIRGTDLTAYFSYNVSNSSHSISNIPSKNNRRLLKKFEYFVF